MGNILVISDTQFPFQHKDMFKFLSKVKEKYEPSSVVHIGDLFDFHSLSDYPTDPDAKGPKDEFHDAMKCAKKLYKMFPKAVILTSNHDVRLFKRFAKAGIPRMFWPSYDEVFQTPKGWEWKDRHDEDGITFVHGHQIHAGGGNVMQNAMRKYMKNIVFGHFHTRFGIDYHSNEDSLMFGMCVGALIDHKLYAFQYQRAQVRKPIIGTGIIINGKPHLIPMYLKKNGRWDGEVH